MISLTFSPACLLMLSILTSIMHFIQFTNLASLYSEIKSCVMIYYFTSSQISEALKNFFFLANVKIHFTLYLYFNKKTLSFTPE